MKINHDIIEAAKRAMNHQVQSKSVSKVQNKSRIYFDQDGNIICVWDTGSYKITHGTAWLRWNEALESRSYGWKLTKGILTHSTDNFVEVMR